MNSQATREWEDKTAEFVKEHYWDDYALWLTEPAWNPPTGGETSVEECKSSIPGDRGDSAEEPTGNVLVVSHKATDSNCSL